MTLHVTVELSRPNTQPHAVHWTAWLLDMPTRRNVMSQYGVVPTGLPVAMTKPAPAVKPPSVGSGGGGGVASGHD